MSKLHLDSSDCEILSLLKRYGQLSGIAEATGLDKGYLSRRLSKIAGLAPVLIRVQSRWQLTPQGQQMVEWYEESVLKQEQILKGKEEILFATTQTISERKIIEILPQVLKETSFKKIRIITPYEGIENALLTGAVDFVFVCAIPQSPEIRYKKLIKWPYVIVMPSSWNDQFKNIDDLLKRPYVAHSRIDMRLLLAKEEEIPSPAMSFDHLIGVREGVVQGIGWAVLPLYTVERELEAKSLKMMKNAPVLTQSEEFQLWWIPGHLDKKVVQNVVSGLGKLLT